MGLSMVSIRHTTRVHGPEVTARSWRGHGGLGKRGHGGLGQQDVKKTPLVIGTMLGITRFLNGSSSFNEAAGMSGTDSIQRRHGARSCGVCQGFVRELCNETTSKGL